MPSEFVVAARAAGAGHLRILGRHLLVNASGAIRVAAVLAVGRAILVESALSFFGVGVQPPAASWGSMLYQAQSAMTTEPWLALFPGDLHRDHGRHLDGLERFVGQFSLVSYSPVEDSP